MNRPNLTITLKDSEVADSAARGPFVVLEAAKQPATTESADMRGIYRMWRRAMDGIPAGSYRSDNCPIEFDGETAHIWLDFYCLPSSPALDFELSADIGEISEPQIVSIPKDRDIIFTLSGTYDLDFYAENISLAWQIPCYIDGCDQVPAPSLKVVNNRIELDREIFSVARLAASAYAEKRRLNIYVDKGDDKITGLSPVITAAWKDSKGNTQTEQLKLELPECVKHALELCKGEGGFNLCSDKDFPVIIYYSICDGSIIDVRSDDKEDWCKEKQK